MPAKEEAANQVENQQQVLVPIESQPVNVKLHSKVELQNEENAHSDYEINTHETNVELPERNMHSDSKVERPNMEIRKEPRLSKYVRRHHSIEQIIGDKESTPMKKKKLRNESCFQS